MTTDGLPVDPLGWSLAILPLLALLTLLVGLRWKAPEAGPVGMFLAGAVAFVAFRAPPVTLAIAGAKGLWDAVFVLYVVWGALLLYKVVDAAGGFEALREGIRRFSRNGLFLVMAFGWVFASFLQSIAGFGAPIAVVAPLLVGLGVRPLHAVVIPLIGHAWCTMFGSLGVGWLATLRVVDLQLPARTALEVALLLWIVDLAAGFAIAWIYGRWATIRHAWPLVLIISSTHGGMQLVFTQWDPVLAAVVAATAALVLLYPLSRWPRYNRPDPQTSERPAMREDAADEGDGAQRESPMSARMALMPYALLVALAVIALVPRPVEALLDRFQLGVPFPSATTGYGLVTESAMPYAPFSPLTHPGTFLLLASVVAYLTYRAKGFYQARGVKRGEIAKGLFANAVPVSVAVAAFLVMSKVMDHTGQTAVLALGISAVAPPGAFAFLSNFIGLVGAFMTSSSTASNILFAPLQQDAAAQLGGLREPTIIAAQSAGGAIGNAVAPANVALGTGTAGIVGREGDILRWTIPWALATSALVGAVTILLSRSGGA